MFVDEIDRKKITYRFKGYDNVVMCEDNKMYKEESVGKDGRIFMAKELKPNRHQRVRNVWYYIINRTRISINKLKAVCYSVADRNEFLIINGWVK